MLGSKKEVMDYYNKGGWWTLIVGIICIAYGLGAFGLFEALMPITFFNDIGVKILLLIGGIFLLIDSFTISSRSSKATGTRGFLGILMGVLLFVIGALPILIEYELLNFLPFFVEKMNIDIMILAGVLVFYGGYLIVDFYLMKRYPLY